MKFLTTLEKGRNMEQLLIKVLAFVVIIGSIVCSRSVLNKDEPLQTSGTTSQAEAQDFVAIQRLNGSEDLEKQIKELGVLWVTSETKW